MTKRLNNNLKKAKSNKKDEFYTQLVDIENELKHYKDHFKDKVVLCNCDDPRVSNFFNYFSYNFEHLGLKKLISTCYKNQDMNLFSENKNEKAIYLEYTGNIEKRSTNVPLIDDIGVKHLKGDGDFRNQECIELLKQADIVVTNPPFSLFREYVSQLVEYDKKFLIVGHQNAITYKEVFKLIITFLDKHNPEQFDILGLGIVGSIDFACNKKMEILDKNGKETGKFTINAKGTLYKVFNPKIDGVPAFKDCETGQLYSSIYARIIIKHKKPIK